MLKLNDIALEAVAGGYKSVTVNLNYLKISANNNEVEKGGSMIFSITQFNGKQVSITPIY